MNRAVRTLLARLGLGLLAASLALRALLPVGYMPGGAGSGSLLVLCPVQSAELVRSIATLDPHAHHHHHHGGAPAAETAAVDKSDGGCGFALALAAALPSAAAPLLAAPVFALLPASTAAALRSFRSSTSARGPPAPV